MKTDLAGLGEVAVVGLAHLIKLLLEIAEVLLASFCLLLGAAEGEVELLLPRLALRHLHPHHVSTTSFERDARREMERSEERGARREERGERRDLNLEITALLFTLVEVLLDLHLVVEVIALDGVDLFDRLL